MKLILICSEAKRLAISFSNFFLHNTTHYIRTATFIQNPTIDRRASPNPNNVERINA